MRNVMSCKVKSNTMPSVSVSVLYGAVRFFECCAFLFCFAAFAYYKGRF